MPSAYPNDVAREIERRWRRRDGMALLIPRNDNSTPDEHCPACDKPGPIAPIVSEYRGPGIIHHRWLCKACGHEWITAPMVAS